jgi:hypothetical protein
LLQIESVPGGKAAIIFGRWEVLIIIRHAEERSDAVIHKALIHHTPPGLFAALTLQASLRLFNALRALVPRYALAMTRPCSQQLLGRS